MEIFETYVPFLWAGLLLLDVIILIWLFFLLRRQKRLAQRIQERWEEGEEGQLLESRLEEAHQAALRANSLVDSFEEVARRLECTVQRVGVVRFSAFPDVGGDQSFSIALLDAHGDGVVISSIQGRNENRIYAKPLERWDSTHALSEEEKQAIAKAYQIGE